MKNDERLTIRIPADLKEAVFEKADKCDLTVSQIVNRLLHAWVTEKSFFGDVQEWDLTVGKGKKK